MSDSEDCSQKAEAREVTPDDALLQPRMIWGFGNVSSILTILITS